MDLELNGQVAVVFGAAGAIGSATASRFAQEGARVALFDRVASVRQLAEQLQQTVGAETWSSEVDVTDYAAVQHAMARLVDSWGQCDHVIVAIGAGSGKFGNPFWNLNPSDWDQVWRINVMGAVHVVHASVPHMIPRRFGTFSLFSSVAGQIGSPTDPPYSAAKAAVINFTRCAAQDLAAFQIRVNAICPGMVKSALNRAVWVASQAVLPRDKQQTYEEWGKEKLARVTPLKRWQEPHEIAALTAFLASPHAANMTGQILNVDGGQVMHG